MNWHAAGKGFIELARQKPALATVLCGLVVAGYLVYAHFGPRYARAEDVLALEQRVTQNTTDIATLKADVKGSRLEGLEGQLFQARVDQCRAESEDLKELYAKRVSKLSTQYQKAGGGDFKLPNCADL